MCPECHEPLIVFELEGIEIDHCVSCFGTWLDAGELELITELAGVGPGRLTEVLTKAKGGRKGRRRCPRCRRYLRLLFLDDDKSGTELDECPSGHGIWFDQGEIKSVIEAFSDGEEGLVAKFFADLFQNELKEGLKQ